MRNKPNNSMGWALGLAWLMLSPASHAGAIYQGSLGTTPGAQGWTSFMPFPASETMSSGAVTLDTSSSNSLQAGYSRVIAPVDSVAGFTLSLTAQLVAESHASGNRAGFSLILLDASHRGVELGFWTDQVWAQAQGFTKAESASFDTTAMADYLLNLHGGNYSLWANGALLLSGAMRDYSAFGAPYTVNNFLFLGDDTTSARGRARIAQVSVVDVSEPPFWALLAGGWLAFGLARSIARFAGKSDGV